MKMPSKSVRDREARIRDRDRMALEELRRSGKEFNAVNLAQALVMLMDQEERAGVPREQPLFEQ